MEAVIYYSRYEGGFQDDPSNYRPISVVSVLAKMLEKIVSVQLSFYLLPIY